MGNFLDKLLGIGENIVDGLEKGLPDDYDRETDETSDETPRAKRVIDVPIKPRDLTVRIVGRIHHVVIDDRFLLCAQDGKSPDPSLIMDKIRFDSVPSNASFVMCVHCVKALIDINDTLLKRAH